MCYMLIYFTKEDTRILITRDKLVYIILCWIIHKRVEIPNEWKSFTLDNIFYLKRNLELDINSEASFWLQVNKDYILKRKWIVWISKNYNDKIIIMLNYNNKNALMFLYFIKLFSIWLLISFNKIYTKYSIDCFESTRHRDNISATNVVWINFS